MTVEDGSRLGLVDPALGADPPIDEHPHPIGELGRLLDATREGIVKPERAKIPDDPDERARHLKSFGYYCDSAMVGICERSGMELEAVRREQELLDGVPQDILLFAWFHAG